MLTRLVKLQTKAAALCDDQGATAVEYGLMVALIAVAIITVVSLLGTNMRDMFTVVANTVQGL